jgi:hypothetical protein
MDYGYFSCGKNRIFVRPKKTANDYMFIGASFNVSFFTAANEVKKHFTMILDSFTKMRDSSGVTSTKNIVQNGLFLVAVKIWCSLNAVLFKRHMTECVRILKVNNFAINLTIMLDIQY